MLQHATGPQLERGHYTLFDTSDDFDTCDMVPFPQFKELSVDNVKALIIGCSKKSCSLDPTPTLLVVECIDVVAPVIVRMTNLSLPSGRFVDRWKEALGTPLHQTGAG